MVAAGILAYEDKAELIRGIVVRKMTVNPPHRRMLLRLAERIPPLLPRIWVLQSQGPIRLRDSCPEPDEAICRRDVVEMDDRHATADDVALVMEVADSSLREDRRVQKPLYAEARIPVYWVINIPQTQIEVYTDPTGPGPSPDYATRTDYGLGDEVPLVLMGTEVGRLHAADLFAPAGGTTP
jgi:Uma2 family endonuclease